MLSRRVFLKTASSGFGYLAFAGLSTWAGEKNNPLAPKAPHFPARAKRVIFLCMEGAPSHVDTFDFKPKLAADDGKTFGKGRVAASAKLLGSPWKFTQNGESGLWVSELFPERRQARRQVVHRQLDAHRSAEPPASIRADAHRHFPVPAAIARRLDALRPWHGERQPAGIRHAQPAVQ